MSCTLTICRSGSTFAYWQLRLDRTELNRRVAEDPIRPDDERTLSQPDCEISQMRNAVAAPDDCSLSYGQPGDRYEYSYFFGRPQGGASRVFPSKSRGIGYSRTRYRD